MSENTRFDRVLLALPTRRFRVSELAEFAVGRPDFIDATREYWDGDEFNAKLFAGYLRRNAGREVNGRCVEIHTHDKNGSWWIVNASSAGDATKETFPRNSCANCSFLDDQTQTCRRMPPQVGTAGTAVWPRVMLHEWCGEGAFSDEDDQLPFEAVEPAKAAVTVDSTVSKWAESCVTSCYKRPISGWPSRSEAYGSYSTFTAASGATFLPVEAFWRDLKRVDGIRTAINNGRATLYARLAKIELRGVPARIHSIEK